MADDENLAPARPGRKPKFTQQELERRTLGAAVDAVLESGVTAGVDAIRIEQVVVESEAPRGATYEFWDAQGDGTSQQNLRRAAVIDIIRNMPSGNVQRTGEYALSVIDEHADRLATQDPGERAAFRRELTRQVASFNFDTLQDQRWRVYKTLVSSIATKQDPELRAAVAEGEEALLQRYLNLFNQLAELFQLQLRSGYTLEHFTMSAYALNEGLSNRISEAFRDQKLIREGKEWTVFAVGFEALVAQYFEPVPLRL